VGEIFDTIKEKSRRLSYVLLSYFILLLFICAFLFHRIVIIVPAGHVSVFWSLFFGGTYVNYVYGEGIHFIFPWDTMTKYDVRIQEISPKFFVLTKSGLRVKIFLSIRYSPEYNLVALLHQKVGPDYAEKIIVPEIESVLREVIGTMDAETVYTTGRKVITKAIDEAIEQLAQRYIIVDDVLIRSIILPDLVQNAIKYKIKQKHLIEAREFKVQIEKKEAERKRVEGEGIRDHNLTVAQSLKDENVLKWHGIQALHAFAHSGRSKVVVLSVGESGVPVILDTKDDDNNQFGNNLNDTSQKKSIIIQNSNNFDEELSDTIIEPVQDDVLDYNSNFETDKNFIESSESNNQNITPSTNDPNTTTSNNTTSDDLNEKD